MTAHDSSESTKVTRRIKGAQRQVDSKSFGKNLATSFTAEWLERNCPNVELRYDQYRRK